MNTNEETKQAVKEMIEMSVETVKQLVENEEIPKLNARIIKLNFDTLKQQGFNTDEAIQLTCAIISRK